MRIGVAVQCTVCGLRKKPIGRSAPVAMANGLCDHECSGYDQEPKPGSLWPGESERDLGHPCGVNGTREEPRVFIYLFYEMVIGVYSAREAAETLGRAKSIDTYGSEGAVEEWIVDGKEVR